MEEKTWKHITLGELYRGGIAKFCRGQRALKHYSPLKLDLTAAQNLWGAIRKTLSFSKSLENHIGAIWYFIHHYNASLPL
jgi:hypothetical protein